MLEKVVCIKLLIAAIKIFSSQRNSVECYTEQVQDIARLDLRLIFPGASYHEMTASSVLDDISQTG